MQKKDKIIFGLIIAGSLLVLLVVFFATGLLHLPTTKKAEEENIGEITQTAEDYDPVQDYNPPEDEAVATDNFTIISNVDSLFGLLTLKALDDLEPALSEWLRTKAYDDSEFLYFTIDETTITDDRSYPYFEMQLDSDKNVKIRVHYDLPEYKWVFDFM